MHEHQPMTQRCISLLLLLLLAGCTSGNRTGEGDATIRELRQTHRVQSLHSTNPLPRMAWVQQRQLDIADGEMTIQIYSPGGNGLPVILLLPSIDFTSGDLVTHDRIARALAVDTPALVILPALPQQPEADTASTWNAADGILDWLSTRVERWGGSAQCITLVAEGAGAGTALELARRNRDTGALNLAGIVLPTPYFGSNPLPEHDDLEGLPPVLMLLGADDPNHDQGSTLSARLQKAGTRIRTRLETKQGPLRSDWALADPSLYEVVLETAREVNEFFSACQSTQSSRTF
jgi:acetyl esterase/lipase